MSTANPQRLGRYLVTRRLGVGGMAEVFLARSRGAEGVDKSLVVKRILPDYAENPHFRAMFVDEARVAMRLNHPNLVQVYGFESDGPTLLIIMEHVDGPDLGLLLATALRAGEPVPPVVAAQVLRELARGLHYAHERLDEQGRALDIVHRDVSPANVLLSYEGAIKLGDFGIAHARSASFTETGLVQGKYGYMAPEQARGEAVDRRADVFALGAVLLELLLGRPWFADIGEAQTLLTRVRAGQLPDVDALAPDAPEALRAVVRRAMRPRPDERFATAREVALALNPFLHLAEQQTDAITLEQFIDRVMPRRQASGAPSTVSSRPPPMELAAGRPTVGASAMAPLEPRASIEGVGSTMPALDPIASVTLPELVLLSDASAPRPPRVEAVPAVRERVNVAVIVGQISRPAHSPETRALAALIDALAFKADATLEWNTDDRFTLLVGVLRPQVDDPLRAARLALDLLDAARGLAADLESVDEALVEYAPTLGLGLARGLAACAFDSDGLPMRLEPVDDALVVASGLAASARPGEALLGAAIARFVRREFVLREAGVRVASGAKTWVLERLRGRAERDTSAEVQGFALLGREGAMAELRDAYDAVIFTESGAARRVVGELGIGKSTLLGAFAEGLLASSSTRVLRVEASLGTSRVPFALIAQLVQQILVLQRGDEPLFAPDLSDPRVLARALDRVVHRAGSGTLGRRAAVRALRSCVGLESHDESAESAITRELALVLRPMLSDAAHDRPIVVLLDGLELADPPSRALIADLARRPPGAPVLLVLALRDDDGLQSELGGVREIVVGPLDHESRRRLIANTLGADQASEVLVQEVSAVVGGNPLAMHEVIEALTERGQVLARAPAEAGGEVIADLVTDDRGEALLPGTLDDVLAARIDALPPSSRALLRWCALCEADLTRPLVDALGGQEGSRARARLVSDGVLVETPGATVLSFAHAALRRLLRAAVDPTAMPAMHARLAELLERQDAAPGASALRHQTALAIHREASGAARPAARAWLDAGLTLARAGARGQREAVEAFERVLALCEGARDLEGLKLQATVWESIEEAARASGRNRQRRGALLALREAAVASQDLGVIARALTRQARFKIEITPGLDTVRDVVAAVRAARRAGDARTEAEARWAWSVHLGHRGELWSAIEQADAAQDALRREAEISRPLEVEVLVTRSTMRRWVGDHQAALDLGAEAIATATRFGPRRLLGAGYDAVGMACLEMGAPAESLRFFRTAISLEREVGGRDRLARSVFHAGKAWSALGRPARALQFVQRAVALAESLRQGFAGILAEALVTLAELRLEQDEVDDAAAAIERARALLGTTGGRYAYVRLCLGDGRVLMARRQYRLARAAVESAESTASASGIARELLTARAAIALAAAHLGDRAAATMWVERVLGDPLMVHPERVHRGARVLRTCAEALRVLGDVRGGDASSSNEVAHRAAALERAVMATWRIAPREDATT